MLAAEVEEEDLAQQHQQHPYQLMPHYREQFSAATRAMAR
jgi:hypothetical protein